MTLPEFRPAKPRSKPGIVVSAALGAAMGAISVSVVFLLAYAGF